jgi:hypothetical protein
MIQVEKIWTDFDEIWCGLYATGDYPRLALFHSLQSIIPLAMAYILSNRVYERPYFLFAFVYSPIMQASRKKTQR